MNKYNYNNSIYINYLKNQWARCVVVLGTALNLKFRIYVKSKMERILLIINQVSLERNKKASKELLH